MSKHDSGMSGRCATGNLMVVDSVLETDRLVLCPVTVQDQAELLAHWSEPQVRRFLFDGEILSWAQITEIVKDSARSFTRAGHGLWVVRESGGTDLIGTVGLRPLEDLGLEVLYSLAPGVWGKGYATEAAGAVVHYALGPLRLPHVLAEIDEGNNSSVAVAERLGMTRFATVPGELGPMVRYRITH